MCLDVLVNIGRWLRTVSMENLKRSLRQVSALRRGRRDMYRIATPYSHLCTNDETLKNIIQVSDAIEIRNGNFKLPKGIDVLWHCDLSITNPWTERESEYFKNVLRSVDQNESKLKLISFHAASRYQENKVVNCRFEGLGEPFRAEQMLENAAVNASLLRRLLASCTASAEQADILVENNNHLGTDAYDVVTSGEFITALTEQADLKLLFDIAHARVTAGNLQIEFDEYASTLPISTCRQMHLSMPRCEGGRYIDSHDPLSNSEFERIFQWTPRCPNLEFMTIEYYKNTAVLLGQISKLRACIQ